MDYQFIGWCHEDNHDKVWALLVLKKADSWGGDVTYATVWGRRGKKLQSKIFTDTEWEMGKLVRSKRNKGYEAVPLSKVNEVYPEFEKDLKKQAFWNSFKV